MLQEIQSDILNHEVPVSAVLRKAKVLAAHLESEELQEWASLELDGYREISDLPDYRVLPTAVSGQLTGPAYVIHNRAVQISQIANDSLKERLSTYHLMVGVRQIEELATNLGEQKIFLSPDVTAAVNHYVSEGGYGYATLHYLLNSSDFVQVLDTVRTRLLDFIIKLDKRWETKESLPPKEVVKQLVTVVILNQPGGGPMTVFDQRGQNVEYQFNAAGNISFESVNSLEELSKQLKDLRLEIEAAKNAQVIPEESAIEAEFHVLQAAKSMEAETPDKKSILDHIGQAKALLEDLTAAAELVAAFAAAAQVVGQLL